MGGAQRGAAHAPCQVQVPWAALKVNTRGEVTPSMPKPALLSVLDRGEAPPVY